MSPLQLLLFVDERPASYIGNQEIQYHLARFQQEYRFELETIDVGKHPDLAEHYKIVVTPALVKIRPAPQQILAGSNLIVEIDNWWEQWQVSLDEDAEQSLESYGYEDNTAAIERETSPLNTSVEYVRSFLKLEDEIFTLKQQQEELTKRLEFQDRAIAMLAHDLRNPLTAASLALGTLDIVHTPSDYRANILDSASVKKLIGQARTQIDAIEKLIADILEPLKNVANDLHISPQKLDLAPVILSTIERMSAQLQQKKQTIATDIPQDLPAVYADEDKIRQAIGNLIDNASKYTPIGGKLQISILHRTTQSVQVTVADNGMGIPETELQKIFQDRYRLDRDRDRSGYGLGLGLCQRIVRAHYGQLWVESQMGKGSAFHFTLLVYQR
jgi:two-component system, OmpR family, clock-associated histidine kinase SasA